MELRSHQQEILSQLLAKQHVYGFLPTGSGKSLCYQIPARDWGWRVLVVSPLVALIEDQVRAAEKLQIKVARIHSALPERDREREMSSIFDHDTRLIFISPERFVQWSENPNKQNLLRSFSLLALDELHCAFDWEDFRGSYAALAKPIQNFASWGLLLGLSGSLSAVQAESFFAKSNLSVKLVLRALGRENLQQFILDLENESERSLLLAALLREVETPSTAIVYCSSRVSAENTKIFLSSLGLKADVFHAGLPAQTRMQRVEDFRSGRLRIVCASNAFGMGIDYPAVDRVIHLGMPYDINSYWQGIGRAGRDGRSASGFVLWCRSDALRLHSMTSSAQNRAKKLWALFLREECRKISLAKYFGLPQEPCWACDVCWRKKNFSLPRFLPDPHFWLYRRQWWLKSRMDTEAWLEEYFISS